jgi:hypothetical protein
MSKTFLMMACALVLSGTAAVAQTNGILPVPNGAPNAAIVVTPTPDVGASSNVRSNPGSTTTIEERQVKQGSAMDAPGSGYNAGSGYENEAMGSSDQSRMRHRMAITDEYGFRYDSRGDRIDANGNVISPHTR